MNEKLCLSEKRILVEHAPHRFSLKAEVAAILPFIGDKILLLQRLSTHPQANLWCAPGGKVHESETPVQAVIRELQEETSLAAQLDAIVDLGKYYVRYPNGDFIFYLFKVHLESHLVNIQIRYDEHQAYGLYSLEEASTLFLTPGLDECFEIAMKN